MVFFFAVCLLDGQRIAQKPFYVFRIILLVAVHFVTDRLDVGILRGVDAQTAAEQEAVRLCLIEALYLHQIRENLLCNLVYKVCIDGIVLGLFVDSQDAAVYIVRYRLIVLSLRDELLVLHVLKDDIPPSLVVVRVGDRVVPGRV